MSRRIRFKSGDGDNRNSYLIGWYDFDGIFTGIPIASTASKSLLVEDIAFIAEEVHMTSNHTDSKEMTTVMMADSSEEFFQAIDVFLGSHWGVQTGQGNQN